MSTRCVGSLLVLALIASTPSMAQRGGPAPVRSPELTSSGDVILRVRAPGAERVRLATGGDIPGQPPGIGADFSRADDGIWELTLESLDPVTFRYRFDIDGVATLDPRNELTSESNGNSWSLFHVPGKSFMDTQRVPHGAVAEVSYFATALNQHRRMHVYTPPGYETSRGRYPVFYLLHGAGDSDNAWSTVGRAGFILDNLIAGGDAEPMIVVMPDGHIPAQAGGNQADFASEFAADIKPYIENHYRVLKGRNNTAIAGLSMGGGQTLDITMSDLGAYGYIGVFSSGVFGITNNDSFEQAHRATLDDPALKDGLEYFWFATGVDDGLLATTAATVEMLRSHGFDISYDETDGAHTWIKWRDYLNDFAPRLFR